MGASIAQLLLKDHYEGWAKRLQEPEVVHDYKEAVFQTKQGKGTHKLTAVSMHMHMTRTSSSQNPGMERELSMNLCL